jgi:hypothetical protein
VASLVHLLRKIDRETQDESQDTLIAHTFVKGQANSAFRTYIRAMHTESDVPLRDQSSPCITERPINSHVNVPLLAAWLEDCDECHGHRQDPDREVQDLEGLRLIDVERHCIVKGSVYWRYAALSYTWGGREQYCLNQRNTSILEDEGYLDNIKGLLGPTVTDALKICSSLKIRYLWIDSLCIVQDDVEAKQSQIDNMDQIYSNAYVTLVGAAGKRVSPGTEVPQNTPELGLSRVSRPASSGSPTGFKLNGQLYSVHTTYSYQTQDAALSKAIWSTRGWSRCRFFARRKLILIRI